MVRLNPEESFIPLLNDGVDREGKKIENDLHMSAQGYVILGKRFAEKSIQLIKKPESN
ncbi:hypothetical protein [Aquiflexum sp.]|uniref:hypothetical protein n=1 Tax=Aquiflexum sp. TaxID=1872584 RepID=UPI003594019C